jgi:hypothetical protein
VVKWFWEVVVDEFDEEHKARLLQFVTGTSGVKYRVLAEIAKLRLLTKRLIGPSSRLLRSSRQ